LTGYIENMSVQPADSVSNIDPDERFLPPRNAHEAGMLRPQLLNSVRKIVWQSLPLIIN